jgi:hypothetical protein
MNKAERIHDEDYDDGHRWTPCDVMAVAVALDSSLITRMETHAVEALTMGNFICAYYSINHALDITGSMRGGIVVDSTNLLPKAKKINIIYRIDQEAYQNGIIHHLN